MSGEFRQLWDRMKLTYDDFIRTTEPSHVRGVQALFKRLKERGYIYKGSYSGQYCVYDELYVDVTEPELPALNADVRRKRFRKRITSLSCRRWKSLC